jgi:hypothetical protein
MTIIKCAECGKEIELTEALTKDIEKSVLRAEHAKHAAELEQVRKESLEIIARSTTEAEGKALAAAAAKVDLKLQDLAKEAEEAKKDSHELRNQLSTLMEELRESKKARDNAQLDMQKKLTEEESKIREEATRVADERQRLNLAAKEKTITDLQKALDMAQRKAAQGSQQLQGEIMELDFESLLTDSFRDDVIEPVAKGVKGGDIRHSVKSPRGVLCGVMLWEVKRTKNWVDSWIPKLKEDLRAERANIPIIVAEVMPKQIEQDLGLFQGVWVCKPQLAMVLASLLRKSLLDVGLQKALAENRGTKADALYSFVTSYEFIQQIESMAETYKEMTEQVYKERVAFEKFWSQREKQAQSLHMGTANIIGSIQGHIGQSSMPQIKGIDLLQSGNDQLNLAK